MTSTDNTTSITLRNEFGEYTIVRNSNIHDIYEVINELVKPVLLAASYPESLVDGALSHDEYIHV